MCVIVDANLAADVFASPPTADGAPVIRWLLRGKGVLIYGGLLKTELSKIANFKSTVAELRRAGRAIDVEQEDPGRYAEELTWCTSQCSSNDPHVIALARVSGARTLVTNDRGAMTDFKNKALVPSPAGSVYQRKEHVPLLTHTAGCRGQK